MELNDHEIDIIQTKIINAGLKSKVLKEELLDHYCTIIEHKMQYNDTSFFAATKQAFELIDQHEIENIQEEYNHIFKPYKKYFIMKMTFVFLFVGILFNPVSSIDKQDPPSIFPLADNFTITSSFGKRLHPVLKQAKMHTGIDFKAPKGTAIFATSDGIVVESAFTKAAGNYIVLKHDNIYSTKYYHIEKSLVKKGDKVKLGATIATVGSTGQSTSPHLHYEVIKNGEAVNPTAYFAKK